MPVASTRLLMPFELAMTSLSGNTSVFKLPNVGRARRDPLVVRISARLRFSGTKRASRPSATQTDGGERGCSPRELGKPTPFRKACGYARLTQVPQGFAVHRKIPRWCRFLCATVNGRLCATPLRREISSTDGPGQAGSREKTRICYVWAFQMGHHQA